MYMDVYNQDAEMNRMRNKDAKDVTQKWYNII